MAPTTTIATLPGPDGLSFYTKTWTPDAATPVVANVLFIHGFVEHVKRYDHVFDKYAQEGIAVFAFDQRGFGETAALSQTPGVTTWALALSDISFFLPHALSLHPTVPLFLQGHSMGGALCLAFATRSPPCENLGMLKGVVVSSALLRQGKNVRAPALLVKVGGLFAGVRPGMVIKGEVRSQDISRDPEVGKIYSTDPLCAPLGTLKGIADMLNGGEDLLKKDYKKWPAALPLLIVHGTGDLVTDCDSSKEFADKLQQNGAKDVKFVPFEGYYHEMHNEPGEDKWTEIATLTDWIKVKL